MGQRAFKAHLDAGPAIGVMRRRDHRNRRRIQVELREISHGRKAGTDVLDMDASLDKAKYQGVFYRQGVIPVIVSNRNYGFYPALLHLSSQAKTQCGHTGKIDRLWILPARVVFAKPGRCDHRVAQKLPRVWGNFGKRLGHRNVLIEMELIAI